MNVSMEHWWNSNDKENLKYSGSNLSQCHFMQQKSYLNFLELKPDLDSEKAATYCLTYGATAHVFNSSVSLGFEIQLQPRTEELYIYSTLKYIHDCALCRGQHWGVNVSHHLWKEMDAIIGLFLFS